MSKTEVKTRPAKKKNEYGLTNQQDRFCHEYTKDYNGTQAAIRAKYSIKTAQEQASRLLSNVMVRARINQLIKEQFDNIKADVKMVLQGLCSAANIDIRMAYDENDNLLPIKDMPEPLAKAITEIKTEELFEGRGEYKEHVGTAKTIKITDRMKARELLGRHFKMFTDVVEHKGLENLADQMKAARKRRESACLPKKSK